MMMMTQRRRGLSRSGSNRSNHSSSNKTTTNNTASNHTTATTSSSHNNSSTNSVPSSTMWVCYPNKVGFFLLLLSLYTAAFHYFVWLAILTPEDISGSNTQGRDGEGGGSEGIIITGTTKSISDATVPTAIGNILATTSMRTRSGAFGGMLTSGKKKKRWKKMIDSSSSSLSDGNLRHNNLREDHVTMQKQQQEDRTITTEQDTERGDSQRRQPFLKNPNENDNENQPPPIVITTTTKATTTPTTLNQIAHKGGTIATTTKVTAATTTATTEKTMSSLPPSLGVTNYTCSYTTTTTGNATDMTNAMNTTTTTQQYQQQHHIVTIPTIVPTFIMIGVQKAGTTALLTYFRDHPYILQTKKRFRREAHFFDTSWNTIMKRSNKELGIINVNERWCYALEQYMTIFPIDDIYHNQSSRQAQLSQSSSEQQQQNPPPLLYTFEKSPSYVSNPMIPQRMKKLVPWSKVILILRNPVERAYSQYKMTIQDVYDLRNYTFEDFIQHEIDMMRGLLNMSTNLLPDIIPKTNVTTTMTAVQEDGGNGTMVVPLNSSLPLPPHVPYGHAVLDSSKWTPPHKALGMYTDRGPLGHQVLLRRGLYAIQLQWWLKYYTLNDDLLVINFADLANNSQHVYERVLEFCGIPLLMPVPKNNNHNTTQLDTNNARRRTTATNTTTTTDMNETTTTTTTFGRVRADRRANDRPLLASTRRYLEEFYAPYNAQLEQLMRSATSSSTSSDEWNMKRLGW